METVDIYTVMDDRRPIRSKQAEIMTSLMELLEPSEKTLMNLYFHHNASVYQLSLLCGRSRQTVGQQIKKLVRELRQGHYPILYRHRHFFGPEKLKVGYDHYLLGLGYRAIAEKRHLPTYTVRNMVRSLEKWAERHKERVKG
jgi:hypothetical protein